MKYQKDEDSEQKAKKANEKSGNRKNKYVNGGHSLIEV